MPEYDPASLFEIFNEIGIINQLSRARLEARLPDGLIEPHFIVLNHLMRVGNGTTPHQMARAFQTPKTSLTHTLKGLEARGLIVMKPNPDDGRSKTVWITQTGRELRGEVIQKLAPDFIKLMDGFDIDALVSIKPILRDLRILMDEAR